MSNTHYKVYFIIGICRKRMCDVKCLAQSSDWGLYALNANAHNGKSEWVNSGWHQHMNTYVVYGSGKDVWKSDLVVCSTNIIMMMMWCVTSQECIVRAAIKLQTRFETLELDLNAKQIARCFMWMRRRRELCWTRFLGSHFKKRRRREWLRTICALPCQVGGWFRNGWWICGPRAHFFRSVCDITIGDDGNEWIRFRWHVMVGLNYTGGHILLTELSRDFPKNDHNLIYLELWIENVSRSSKNLI